MKVMSADNARLTMENNRLKRRCAELEASLEYVAMMADVELPEETDEEEAGEDE